MKVECFLDTNVLVYAATSDTDRDSMSKRECALGLINSKRFGLSVQVLQEFYVVVTRKLERPLTPEQALAFMDAFQAFSLLESDYALVVEGIQNSIRYHLSYWDGAIIAAAERLNAPVLYTEDLNDGQHYGSVQACDPFAGFSE